MTNILLGELLEDRRLARVVQAEDEDAGLVVRALELAEERLRARSFGVWSRRWRAGGW